MVRVAEATRVRRLRAAQLRVEDLLVEDDLDDVRDELQAYFDAAPSWPRALVARAQLFGRNFALGWAWSSVLEQRDLTRDEAPLVARLAVVSFPLSLRRPMPSYRRDQIAGIVRAAALVQWSSLVGRMRRRA